MSDQLVPSPGPLTAPGAPGVPGPAAAPQPLRAPSHPATDPFLEPPVAREAFSRAVAAAVARQARLQRAAVRDLARVWFARHAATAYRESSADAMAAELVQLVKLLDHLRTTLVHHAAERSAAGVPIERVIGHVKDRVRHAAPVEPWHDPTHALLRLAVQRAVVAYDDDLAMRHAPRCTERGHHV